MKKLLAALLASASLASLASAAPAAELWYRSETGSAGIEGAAYGAPGRITCSPFMTQVALQISDNSMGANLTTPDPNGYASFAIYDISHDTASPYQLLAYTGPVSLAAVGGVSGSFIGGMTTSSPALVVPFANGTITLLWAEDYFVCMTTNSATAAFVAVDNRAPGPRGH